MSESQSYLIASALFFIAMGIFESIDGLPMMTFSLIMGLGCLLKWALS